MGVVSGAKIAGAIRIRAATRSGASKYVLTATRQPAECLACHFGDISGSKNGTWTKAYENVLSIDNNSLPVIQHKDLTSMEKEVIKMINRKENTTRNMQILFVYKGHY